MGVVGALLGPEAEALVRLRAAAWWLRREVAADDEHWAFAYSMLHRVSRSFAIVIQQLGPDLRNAVCVFYLVLRALDTVDTKRQLKKLPGEWVQEWQRLVGIGLSRLFHAAGLEDLAPESLSNSMGLFLQKVNITRDYLEDINEIPKSRMFWPREIWSKYVDKLEDLKYENNSVKAVKCLNEMMTNGLIHTEDCLRYMSALKDITVLRFCAIPQVMALATYALCYNNVNVFRGVVKLRRGLTARIINETNSMADVYAAFYEFSSLLAEKIDDNDPNASLTRKRVNAIKETCKSSGLLKRRGYDLDRPKRNPAMIMMLLLLLVAIFLGALYRR
uniref:Squalene synthase n=1 Tax=Oryza meridionalis TaxID=40149 RepID=A0A0E0E8V7_9ORYZ